MGLNIILQRVRCVAQRHASVLHRSQHNFLRFHGALAKRKHDRNPAIRIWNACPMLDIHAISSLLVVSMKQVARPYLLGIPPPFAAPSHLPAQPPEQRPVLPWHGPRSLGSACFLFHMPWSLKRLRRLTVRGNIDYIHYILSLLPPTSTRATGCSREHTRVCKQSWFVLIRSNHWGAGPRPLKGLQALWRMSLERIRT